MLLCCPSQWTNGSFASVLGKWRCLSLTRSPWAISSWLALCLMEPHLSADWNYHIHHEEKPCPKARAENGMMNWKWWCWDNTDKIINIPFLISLIVLDQLWIKPWRCHIFTWAFATKGHISIDDFIIQPLPLFQTIYVTFLQGRW